MQKKAQSDKRWERAKLGIDMLLVATRLLKTHEIQGILSTCLEDSSINFEKRRSVRPLTELLGPMVDVHADGSVDLIHPSAKEYSSVSNFLIDKSYHG